MFLDPDECMTDGCSHWKLKRRLETRPSTVFALEQSQRDRSLVDPILSRYRLQGADTLHLRSLVALRRPSSRTVRTFCLHGLLYHPADFEPPTRTSRTITCTFPHFHTTRNCHAPPTPQHQLYTIVNLEFPPAPEPPKPPSRLRNSDFDSARAKEPPAPPPSPSDDRGNDDDGWAAGIMHVCVSVC